MKKIFLALLLMAAGLTSAQAGVVQISRVNSGTVKLDWSPSTWQLQTATALGESGTPIGWSNVIGSSPLQQQTTLGKHFYRAVSTDGSGTCSSNVVGYVSLSILPGTNLIANPLKQTSDHLNNILPLAGNGSQDGVTIYRWRAAIQGYSGPIVWSSTGGWFSQDPNENFILDPGEGFFLLNPFRNPFNVVFIGDVMQGPMTNRVPIGISFQGNPVPQAVPVSTILCPASPGEAVLLWDPAKQNFVSYQYDPAVGWVPEDPTIPVGAGFVVSYQGNIPQSCTRTFSVPCTGLGPSLAINTQPADQVVNCFGTATFTVGASGVGALTYQWRRNGCGAIPGANAATLILSNVTLPDAGNYSVDVSDGSARITSNDATLSLNPSATPRLHISDGTNLVISWPRTCQDFVLQEADSLNSPIDWRGVGRNMNLNGSNLLVTIPLSESKGFYRLASSSTRITTSPKGGTANIGEVVNFRVDATGPGQPVFNYQWHHNGQVLNGQTGNTLSFDVTGNDSYGTYEAIVIDSSAAHLAAPAFIHPPGVETILPDNVGAAKLNTDISGSIHGSTSDATREAGEPLHAGVLGGKSVWFAWQPPTQGIATFDTIGSSFDTLLAVYTGTGLSNLQPVVSDDDSGGFLTSRLMFNASPNSQYFIAIDGAAGAGGFFNLSWNLEPTAALVPIILVQPQDGIVLPDDKFTFSVVATSPPPATLTYQWFHNGLPIVGIPSSPQFVINNSRSQDLGEYHVVVTGGQRSVESRHASLQISSNPAEFHLEPKILFDFLCGIDTINAGVPDARLKSLPKVLAPASAGSLSGSLASFSPVGGPKGICTFGGTNATAYSLVNVASANCVHGSTLTFSLQGTPGYSVVAVYYTLTASPMACAAGIEPTVSINAARSTTYRVVVGNYSGGALSLNYTNSPCK